MDGFDEPYWNLIQVLAWVYSGDRGLVRRASDDVIDHGTFSQQLRLPDGRKDWTETAAEAPGPVELEVTAAYRGGAAYPSLDRPEAVGKTQEVVLEDGLYPSLDDAEDDVPSLDDAEDDVLAATRDGRLSVRGLKNGKGDLQEIPQIQRAALEFYFDQRERAYAAPRIRSGATHWHGLKFLRTEVLALWPDPFDNVLQGESVPAPGQSPAAEADSALPPPSNLTDETRSKGGSKPHYNASCQQFIDQRYVEFESRRDRLTVSHLKTWLEENARPEQGDETGIPSCDDIEFYENRIWWKDETGSPKSKSLRAAERYIARAKVRTSR